MENQTAGNIVALIAAILSGGLTSWVSIYLYRKQDRSLEGNEIRRRKIDIISQILGMKYILVDGYIAYPGEVMAFNSALSLFPLFFSDNKKVMRDYDSYITDPKSTDKLVQMLRTAGATLNLDVPDSVLRRNLTINASRIPLDITATFMGRERPPQS